MIAKAFLYLLKKGESLAWVDEYLQGQRFDTTPVLDIRERERVSQTKEEESAPFIVYEGYVNGIPREIRAAQELLKNYRRSARRGGS